MRIVKLFISLSLLIYTQKVLAYPECNLNGKNEDYCSTTSNQFVYDTEFGGRSIDGNNLNFIINKLEHIIPQGWYFNKTAELNSSLISTGNYDSSLKLFGNFGVSLAAGSLSECSYSSLGVLSPLNNSCKIIGVKFVYQAPNPYGSRTQECATPTSVTQVNPSKCWLKVGSGTFLSSANSLPACLEKVDVNGKVSQDCSARVNDNAGDGSYYYTTEYNGKSLLCSASALGTSNTQSCYIPTDKTYYKVTSSSCTVNANNTSECLAGVGLYPYTTAFGGRSIACDATTNVSNCWFAGATKSTGIGANLISSNIKTGVNIFGVIGTYDGSPTNWSSSAHKTDGSIKSSYKDEATCGLDQKISASICVSTASHRWVPIIALDHDGEGSNFYVDRSSWANTECGLSGDLTTRSGDCLSKIAAALTSASVAANKRNTAVWNGDGSVGNSGFSSWSLISRIKMTNVGFVEVWRDDNTKLLWSSRISDNLNWCQSSGSSNNSIVADIAENDPSNICNQQVNQEQVSSSNVFSACYEGTGFTDNNSYIPQFAHASLSGAKAAGKAGIHSESAQKVYWRLPTIFDYRIANYNGMRFVLPDMAGSFSNQEWTATVSSENRSQAWTFQSATGEKNTLSRSTKVSVRCVGRGL